MVLDPDSAKVFVEGYRQVLLMVHSLKSLKRSGTPEDRMVVARHHLAREAGLLDEALESLERRRDIRLPEGVVDAIRTLDLEAWVYVRDAGDHSIFLLPEGFAGFGVVGLTQPVRELTGGPGCVVEAGVVAFEGRFVFDGLPGMVRPLDPGTREGFEETHANLCSTGAFHIIPRGGFARRSRTITHQGRKG